MNVKLLTFGATLLLVLPLLSAPPAPPKDSLNATLNQLKNNLSTVRNSVANHETEIRMFEQKLETFESNFDTLQETLHTKTEQQQNALQNLSIHTESTSKALENTLNSLVNDLRLIKQQGNDTVEAFAQYKQKLLEIEKTLNSQNQQIDIQNQQILQLEAAIKSLMGILQAKESNSYSSVNTPIQSSSSGMGLPNSGASTYKVQAGDTLEKIARKNNVSLKLLKEINRLSDDRIRVGQVLTLPSS